MSEQKSSNNNISVGVILSWIFGVIFALIGIITIFTEPIPGLVMLIMAAVLLPPITRFVEEKWKMRLSGIIKAIVIIIGIIIVSATIDTSDASSNKQVNVTKKEVMEDELGQPDVNEEVNDDGEIEAVSDEKTAEISFNDQSRARFDEIKEAFPELDSIECYNDDCTSVIYFNFNTIPDDLDFAIRGNTVTFSNFKYEHTGTSHVSIFASYNGKTILKCNGSKGVVDDCE